MDPHDYLDGGTVAVAPTEYAICRMEGTEPPASAFAVVRDDTETTAVVDERDGVPDAATAVSRGWKRLTFEMELPFELVGFLAVVADELARAGVSIYALSSYSTDHVLVTESDLDAAVDRLDSLGCVVR
ncbi:ACT domain-containing protein [Halobaculum lipolyticum]|uniref:ACT domain-containing protein n=1 Tax=Halobaculum lipolyticum TaxID=3032001 RepID=A0ABD5W9N8_9EURY|nr:ACT domain-containing protein [Halobaculum sp. DT31]